jgi:hypothetical protein
MIQIQDLARTSSKRESSVPFWQDLRISHAPDFVRDLHIEPHWALWDISWMVFSNVYLRLLRISLGSLSAGESKKPEGLKNIPRFRRLRGHWECGLWSESYRAWFWTSDYIWLHMPQLCAFVLYCIPICSNIPRHSMVPLLHQAHSEVQFRTMLGCSHTFMWMHMNNLIGASFIIPPKEPGHSINISSQTLKQIGRVWRETRGRNESIFKLSVLACTIETNRQTPGEFNHWHYRISTIYMV